MRLNFLLCGARPRTIGTIPAACLVFLAACGSAAKPAQERDPVEDAAGTPAVPAPAGGKDAALPASPTDAAFPATNPKDTAASLPDASAGNLKADVLVDGIPPSSAPDAASSGPGFDPKTLGDGLSLWLDAAIDVTTTGDKVMRWGDQSGKGNHALGQATRMPTLKTNAQGQPFIQFTGKATPKDSVGVGGPYLRIADSAGLNFGKGDWVITVVAGYSNAIDATHMGAVGAIFSKCSASFELEFTGNWPVAENPNVEKSFLYATFGEREPSGFDSCQSSSVKPCENLNDGKLRVYSLEKVGGTMYIRINGQRAGHGGGFANTVFDVKADAYIGSMFVPKDGSANFGGNIVSNLIVHALKADMYLMMVHKGTLAPADLTALEVSLMTRFSIKN